MESGNFDVSDWNAYEFRGEYDDEGSYHRTLVLARPDMTAEQCLAAWHAAAVECLQAMSDEEIEHIDIWDDYYIDESEVENILKPEIAYKHGVFLPTLPYREFGGEQSDLSLNLNHIDETLVERIARIHDFEAA